MPVKLDDQNIPVVDLGAFLSGTSDERLKLAQRVDEIFRSIGFLIIKNHDDFSYYHFPYTYYLNEYPLIVGLGQYGHGFRTPSSLFYLNSIFYLPIVKYYMINVGALMIMGFSNLIILSNLIKTLKSKQFNYLFILGLLSFAFINIFFYRIAEHGTDRSAQILILIFV